MSDGSADGVPTVAVAAEDEDDCLDSASVVEGAAAAVWAVAVSAAESLDLRALLGQDDCLHHQD